MKRFAWYIGFLILVFSYQLHADNAPAPTQPANNGSVTNNSDIPINLKVTKSDDSTQDIFIPKGGTTDLPPGTDSVKAGSPTNDQLKQLPKDEAREIRKKLFPDINVTVTHPDGSKGKVDDSFWGKGTAVKPPVQTTVTPATNATNTYMPPPQPQPEPKKEPEPTPPAYTAPKSEGPWTPHKNEDGTYQGEKQMPTEPEHNSAYDTAYGDIWREFSKGKITKAEYEKKIKELQEKYYPKKTSMNDSFKESDSVGFAQGESPKARDMDIGQDRDRQQEHENRHGHSHDDD